MNTLGESWSAGPTGSTPAPPPRPDVAVAVPTGIGPVTRYETFASVPSWKRIGAILGVIGGFFFFLTIPGWIALGHYRKWKRNEIPTPNGLIAWGYIWSGLLVLVLILGAIAPAS